MTKVRNRRSAIAAAVLAAGLLLTGCSTSAPQAGAAATMGDARITEQQLTDQVHAILEAQRQPVDTPNVELTSKTLSRMITMDLVNTLARDNGIVVTQGDIDQRLAQFDSQAGGRDQVEKIFAEQGVAPSQINAVVRLDVQAQQLGIELDPHGSAEQQGAAVVNAVTKLSNDLEVTASPRFGTWDPVALTITPGGSDLTAPPALAK
jgi:hypothetical protein